MEKLITKLIPNLMFNPFFPPLNSPTASAWMAMTPFNASRRYRQNNPMQSFFALSSDSLVC